MLPPHIWEGGIFPCLFFYFRKDKTKTWLILESCLKVNRKDQLEKGPIFFYFLTGILKYILLNLWFKTKQQQQKKNFWRKIEIVCFWFVALKSLKLCFLRLRKLCIIIFNNFSKHFSCVSLKCRPIFQVQIDLNKIFYFS